MTNKDCGDDDDARVGGLQEAAASAPRWDPVQQIYVGGVIPGSDDREGLLEMINETDDGKLRIFGYGSLCWNPGNGVLSHPSVTRVGGGGGDSGGESNTDSNNTSSSSSNSTNRTRCMAIGYRRCWSQKSTDHRGIPSFPGIVCTLLKHEEMSSLSSLSSSNTASTKSLYQRGTEGVIYEVPTELIDDCLKELDFREKGGYARDIIDVAVIMDNNNNNNNNSDDHTTTSSCSTLMIRALLYRGTPENPAFWSRPYEDLRYASAVMSVAIGPSGRNDVYLHQLSQFLLQAKQQSKQEKQEQQSHPPRQRDNESEQQPKEPQQSQQVDDDNRDDDTVRLSCMTKIIQEEYGNVHFFSGCGSNQHNQLLLRTSSSRTSNSNSVDSNSSKKIKNNKEDQDEEIHATLMESVLFTTKDHHPTTLASSSPHRRIDPIVNIYGGGGHSGMLTKDGKLYLFGWDENGQLGTSGMQPPPVIPKQQSTLRGTEFEATGAFDGVDINLPIQIQPLQDLRVQMVALGFSHTVVVEKDTGYLYAFGDDTRGQVLGGTLPMNGIAAVTANKNTTTHNDENHQDNYVSTGNNDPSAGVKTGQQQPQRRIPVTPSFLRRVPVVHVAAGLFHTAVATSDGELITYGCGRHGQTLSSHHQLLHHHETSVAADDDDDNKIAANTRTKTTTAPAVRNIRVGKWKPPPAPNNDNKKSDNSSGGDGTKILKVACGRRHTVALDDSGRIWTFGDNKYGQLGREIIIAHDHDDIAKVRDETKQQKSNRTQKQRQQSQQSYDPIPRMVDFRHIANEEDEGSCSIEPLDVVSGWSHTIILARLKVISSKTSNDDDGKLFLFGWGRNDKGQLGINTSGEDVAFPKRIFPIVVGGETAAAAVAVRSVRCGSESTYIVDDHDTIWSSGWNEHGNLSLDNDGTTALSDAMQFTKMTGIDTKVSATTTPGYEETTTETIKSSSSLSLSSSVVQLSSAASSSSLLSSRSSCKLAIAGGGAHFIAMRVAADLQ